MRQPFVLLPGLALAAAIMLVGLPIAEQVGVWVLGLQRIDPSGRASPISGVLTAIVIGMLIRNFIGLPEAMKAGVQFSATTLLRFGVILVGIRLSLVEVLRLGGWGMPVVIIVITSGLLFITWFNRWLKLPARLGTLIAAGTGICGVTAIVSVAPAIRADEREVAYAVANVTVFGLIGMFVYPYLAHELLSSSAQVGLFLGTAVHETAQVVGAAMTYQEMFQDPDVLQAATITKLSRNLFLAAVVPLLSLYYLRAHPQVDERLHERVRLRGLFPMFVLGFLAMSLVRSIGDATSASGLAFGIWDVQSWSMLTTTLGDVWGGRYVLGTAMAAVGLGASFSIFRHIGVKPFAVGLVGALLVGGIGFTLAYALGRLAAL